MAGLSAWHLLILLMVVVLLFGAKRLPDMARAIGQSVRIFKGEMRLPRPTSTPQSHGQQRQPHLRPTPEPHQPSPYSPRPVIPPTHLRPTRPAGSRRTARRCSVFDLSPEKLFILAVVALFVLGPE
jgi:sec-independent protein translocase protein TatA